jgi:heterodisulfide reductase subunit B
MYTSNTVAPSLEHEDFYWWLYEAIEYACKYRGWRDTSKKLNAQQCINKCIDTIKLQKYYDMRLDKKKTVNFTVSMDAPIGGDGDDAAKTIADMLESEECWDDHSKDDVILLVQNYINRNKIVEAILIDNIAFNDVQRYYKKTVKTDTSKYTEYSSEFWPFKLVKIINELSAEYKDTFMKKYKISEEKLDSVLAYLDKVNNQRIYKLLERTLNELRAAYLLG